MAGKWEELTPEEREAYVSQDEVRPRYWREVPASGFLEALEGEESLADMIGADAPDDAGVSILDNLHPVQAECLRLHYVEGRKLREIAARMAKEWVVNGRVIQRKQFTVQMVWVAISRGKQALARLCGREVEE